MRSRLLGSALILSLLALGTLPAAHSTVLAPQAKKHKKGLKFKTLAVSPKNGGGEPSIAMGVGPNKKYMYISYPGSPGMAFYYSADKGKTWTAGGIADDNSGDTSVNTDSSGAVYQSNLRGISGNPDSLQGDVYKSLDNGVTWGDAATNSGGGSTATDNPVHVDREWTDAYIPPGKTTDEARVYIGYHDFGPGLVWVNASTDGGKTFGEAVNVVTSPEAQEASACNTIPGSLKVVQRGPHAGRIYMSWIAADAGSSGATGCNYTQEDTFYNAWVAYSDDEGATWTDQLVYDGGVTHDMGELFPDMTLDKKGNPYIAVADNLEFDASTQTTGEWDIYVFASFDGGKTWNGSDTGDGQLYKVNTTKGTHYYPSIAAGAPGRVDVAWIETPDLQDVSPHGKPVEPNTLADAEWNVYMGQTLNLKSGHPKWKVTKVTKAPIHKGDVCVLGIFCTGFEGAGASRSLLDFIDIAVDSKGKAHIAYTADYDAETACICVAHQTKGPKVIKKKKHHRKK